jgi:hypothetical protein
MFLEHIIVISLLVGFAIKVCFLIELVIELSFEKVALKLGTFESSRGRLGLNFTAMQCCPF